MKNKTKIVQQKGNSYNIIQINPTISISILKVNGLNIAVKRQKKCQRGFKKHYSYLLSVRNLF